MTPEQFLTFAEPLPEAMLLVTSSGVVLAGNRAVERLGPAMHQVTGKNLAVVVTDSPDDIAHYLRSCSRSGSLVPGSVNLLGADGESVSYRAEGTLLQPRTEESEARLLLRLIPKHSSVGQFVALNHRIDRFSEEIRRRRIAEAEAREQADRLRVTLRSIGDAVIVTDPEGRVSLLNPVAQAMTGWTLEEAAGQSLPDVFRIINEYTRELVENPALPAREEGEDVGLPKHTVLVAKDGAERRIDHSSAPIQADDGTLLGAVLVFRDVTQRQLAEEKLRRSERQFRQLADAMPQIVWSAEPDGQIDYINRQWTNFTGLPDTSGNGGWSHVVHPDEFQAANEQWAASVRGGTPFEMQLRLLGVAQQGYRWHLVRTVAVRDDAGRLVRWFGTSTDIHDQKRAEASASYLAQASAALAGVVDYESTLQTVANLAVPHFADWSAVDIAADGNTLRRLAVAHRDPEKVQIAHELMQRYPPDPQDVHGPLTVLHAGTPEMISDITDELLVLSARDDTHLSLIRSLGLKSYICVPLIVSGKTLGVLTFATAESERTYNGADLTLAVDLAHRASVAVENTQLYQALRDSDRRKDEFLATLAHELRNPLAPIRNALELLKMPTVDAATATRSRDMMERQVGHLVRLVDDLLDVSRVIQGKIQLRRERIELATVVAHAVETVQPLMDAKGHRVHILLPSESLSVDADPVRLAQVIGNLLTNAAKYTEPRGQIWLTAERDGGTAELRVRDSGIGIGPEMLPRVFELFVQVDHAATQAQGGLGIGLTLVKNLVDMHDGTVEARSDGLGRGSEFIIRLPISARTDLPDHFDDSGEMVRRPPATAAYRLMVVDDNQDAAESLGMLLELQGHHVRVASSGDMALEITKNFMPDVVFLDIGMPGMDGYEVARRLRQRPGLRHVVLAALSGWGQEEDRRRTTAAGFDHHLIKPPEPRAVEAVLTELGRRRHSQSSGSLRPGNENSTAVRHD